MTDTLGIADDEYDVTVSLKIAMRKRGEYPSLRDEESHVLAALIDGAEVHLPTDQYPKGTVRLLSIESRVLDAKALRRAQRRWLKDQTLKLEARPAHPPQSVVDEPLTSASSPPIAQGGEQA